MISYSELVISSTIALLYPFFFYKLTDYATRDARLNIKCWDSNDVAGRTNCYDMQKPLKENQRFILSMTMLLIGILTIAASGFIKTPSTKLGLGLAGLFCVIYAIIWNWGTYQELVKILILGLSLIVLFMLSIRLYSVDNISDIFVPDYGTLKY